MTRVHRSVNVRPSRRSALALLVLLSACGGSPPRFQRGTRVAAERRVLSDDPALREYFAAVYGHQRVLAGVVRRRMDGFASLADALDLPENADRDTLLQSLREVIHGAGAPTVRIEPADEEPEAAVDAWHRALLDPTPDEASMRAAIDRSFDAVRSGVVVRFSPAPPERLAPVYEALATIHREAVAARLCMLRLTGTTATPLQRGAALFASHPELAAEFRAAETAVLGFHVRATRHAQESLRVTQWVADALRAPEGPASPPVSDAGAPRAQAQPSRGESWTTAL